ncbi:MAG: ATP-binding cassette domain-containing protein, partial [bacterium]|nr:ATP-binding cassette domain-containing protein [bacterium]
ESLFRYNKIEKRIKDRPRAGDLNIKQGVIEFRNVSFKYHKQNIFEDFNLKIRHNEKVAVVGPSGCGKTTLIKLLYRLYDVDKGTIRVDGKDIRNVNQQSLRSEMAVVPQECILFDDTIMNNISFSRPGIGPEKVFESMKLAQLDKIVKRFPNRENTIVGERGVKLSGGEKQRVSIARALLADKKIVVLDEATSSLDSRTEHEIQRDFQKLFKGRTAIIIAHRLSTIMNADRVIVMDEGRIVQTGKHKDLVKRKGIYRDLWELQKNGYIE